MGKQIDRRTLRAMARRAAYEDAAIELRATGSMVRGRWGEDGAAVKLYLEERRALLAWLRARADGRLMAPPGGVGSRRG
jgi:hypothetical protein